jgi:hypothetical protein
MRVRRSKRMIAMLAVCFGLASGACEAPHRGEGPPPAGWRQVESAEAGIAFWWPSEGQSTVREGVDWYQLLLNRAEGGDTLRVSLYCGNFPNFPRDGRGESEVRDTTIGGVRGRYLARTEGGRRHFQMLIELHKGRFGQVHLEAEAGESDPDVNTILGIMIRSLHVVRSQKARGH